MSTTSLFLTRQSYDYLLGIFHVSFWENLNQKVTRRWSLEGTRFDGINGDTAREIVQHLPPGYGYWISTSFPGITT